MTPRPHFDSPIAHRGLHDRSRGVIENSRTAFERAIGHGFAIECDVQLSRDGVPMVFHDDGLERLTGLAGLVVGSVSADELSATPLLESADADTPQRLSAFLRQIEGRTPVQIELKRQPNSAASVALANGVAAALASYGGPVTVESFDPNLVRLVHRSGFRGHLGIITARYDRPAETPDLTGIQRFGLRHLLHWPWTRFDFISCDKAALGLPAVRLFRVLGVPVVAWTIRTAEEQRRAASGADQIVFEGFEPARG